MIEVKIKCSNGYELADDDVVLITYINKKMYDVGVMRWLERADAVVAVIGDSYISWGNMRNHHVQILGNANERPLLLGYVDKHRYRTERDATRALNAMFADITGEKPKRKVSAIGNGVKGRKVGIEMFA